MDGQQTETLTEDTFFNGRIRVKQSRTGYRFSIDAVLLADRVRPRPGQSVLDLGTGCGIIPLILGYRYPSIHIYAVEVQATVASVAARNVQDNRMADRVIVVQQDMKMLPDGTIDHPVDWVVSNPPHRRKRSGRLNPDCQRAVSRHELMVTLVDVVAVARRMLKTGGRLAMLYPAERSVEALCAMRDAGIAPKKLRLVYSTRGTTAKRVIIEGRKGGKSDVVIDPPLYVYRSDGSYSHAVSAMFQP